MQATCRFRREVGHQARSRAAHLLHGQLNADVSAFVAVVEHGHGPGQLRSLGVIARMIVTAVVSELLHVRSEPRTRPGRWPSSGRSTRVRVAGDTVAVQVGAQARVLAQGPDALCATLEVDVLAPSVRVDAVGVTSLLTG